MRRTFIFRHAQSREEKREGHHDSSSNKSLPGTLRMILYGIQNCSFIQGHSSHRYSKFYFSYKHKNIAPGWDLKEVKGYQGKEKAGKRRESVRSGELSRVARISSTEEKGRDFWPPSSHGSECQGFLSCFLLQIQMKFSVYFETGSHAVKQGLRLAVEPRMSFLF